MCGVHWVEALHDGIAGSRLVIFERSGHFGHLEEPAAFAGAVVEFAKGLDV
ncbi:alpha/beta fold hydrolase [Amycolatopsis sp. FDAARGOS 1241]|uniref:alpha/beta fold hydrolase n=1 Tax=Amycolatopsis sp. FDAARGOS 1241 TaxID=2778070 RepID=UPI00351C89AF